MRNKEKRNGDKHTVIGVFDCILLFYLRIISFTMIVNCDVSFTLRFPYERVKTILKTTHPGTSEPCCFQSAYTLLSCLFWGFCRVSICGKGGFARLRATPKALRIGFANRFRNLSCTLSWPLRIGFACVKSQSLRQRLREPSPHIMYHTNAFAHFGELYRV